MVDKEVENSVAQGNWRSSQFTIQKGGLSRDAVIGFYEEMLVQTLTYSIVRDIDKIKVYKFRRVLYEWSF